MQWLIDLVIEQIGVPPCFISRGSTTPNDFTFPDFTVDGNSHDLDYSAIVPAGATAVLLHIVGASANIADIFYFRQKTHTAILNTCIVRPQIANHNGGGNWVFVSDPDRVFSYRFAGVGWTFLKISCLGWWL